MSSSPAKAFALTARRYQQSHNGALHSKKVLRNTHRLISTSRVKQHHDQSGKSKVNGELLAMVTLAAASVSLSNERLFDSADKSARCSGIATAVSQGSHDTSHDFLLQKFSVLKRRDNDIFSKLAVKDLSVDIMTPTESKPQLSVKTSSIIKNENDHGILNSPDPYPHWTLKECMEQPEAIACVLGFGNRLSMDEIILGGLDENITSMSKIMHLTLSACGTSLNAAKYAEKLMKALGSFENVFSVDAAEAEEDDTYSSLKASECGLIVMPGSGMGEGNVEQVAQAAMHKHVTIMNVASDMNMNSNAIDIDVYSNAGQEKHVTSTNAFSTQVTVLALVALWFRQMRDKMHGISTPSNETRDLKESLMRLPISFGMAKKTRSQCKKIAQRLEGKEHCFILGKGFAEPVALEGALKMKQVGRLHAEGYSGGALKHGPFALIENDEGTFGATPIILLILDDQHARHMRTAAEEVKARGADLMIITDNPDLADGLDSNPILITSNGPLTALGAILPLQLIAYELAMLRNINPDIQR